MERFHNKVVIVAGGGLVGDGWGIGRSVAVRFAQQGARVLIADRSHEAAEDTKSLIMEEGGTAEIFVGDLSRAADAKAMVETCRRFFGRLDVLHNNIGVMVAGDVVELSETQWERAFTINLKTMFLTCKFAIPAMLETGGGAIVNLGSAAGVRTFARGRIAYNTSKGAVLAFTRSLAADWGPDNIRSNVVLPGVILTPAWENDLQDIFGDDAAEQSRRIQEERVNAIPLRRLGHGLDIADAVTFLASDEARYINGAELVVDGGLICRVPER